MSPDDLIVIEGVCALFNNNTLSLTTLQFLLQLTEDLGNLTVVGGLERGSLVYISAHFSLTAQDKDGAPSIYRPIFLKFSEMVKPDPFFD